MKTEYQQIHLILESSHDADSAYVNHEPVGNAGLRPGAQGDTAPLAPDRGSAVRSAERPGPMVPGDGESAGARRGMAPATALVVPPEPAWLVAEPGESPRLARRKPAGSVPCVRLEVVTLGRQLRLLLMCPGEQRVRVNGVIAPPLVALKENDCVRLDADVALHVALFNRPCIGPVNAKLVGKECPVCRVPFAVNVRCCSCACGAAMHCEEDAVTDGLQCAQLRSSSGCIVCQRPVILQPGYNCLPEVQIE